MTKAKAIFDNKISRIIGEREVIEKGIEFNDDKTVSVLLVFSDKTKIKFKMNSRELAFDILKEIPM